MHRFLRHQTGATGIDVVSITSDRSFPRHTHDEYGLGYIVDGGQESWSGRGLVEARAGDIITVNPGEVHDGIGRAGKSRSWRMIYVPPALAAHYCSDTPGQFEFTRPVISKARATRTVASAIGTLVAPDAQDAEVEEALLLAFGALQDQFATADRATHQSQAVAHMLERIRDDLTEPLSLACLAECVGLSRFQTLRLFAKEVGATPHAYLTQLRIKAVKRMIEAGTPLADASVACGFADQSHMSRAFLRQYGVTPGQYRRRS